MTPTQTNEIRKAAWHHVSDESGRCAGMKIADLQQFIAGQYHPDDAQLFALAKRFGIWEKIR